jgi:serine/threonine protein kinase
MDTRNQKKIGRYQLLALLATGGMAEIYLARQEGIKGFERLVVIKKILPHLARRKRFVEMFFDEARIAALLSHPNIVQIYDLGEDESDSEGSYYIAMEYLEGESLGYLVKQARKASRLMPSQLAAGIVAQVCDGLDYAHKLHDPKGKPLNIVHRDVSPHNIIVLFSGGVKLVDFGIAKAASQVHQTREGSLKGKLTYIAPEQCESKPVDARSDVFSMGVVLWELLTRRRLFKRDSDAAKVQAIMSDPIPQVRDMISRPQWPPNWGRSPRRRCSATPPSGSGPPARWGRPSASTCAGWAPPPAYRRSPASSGRFSETGRAPSGGYWTRSRPSGPTRSRWGF